MYSAASMSRSYSKRLSGDSFHSVFYHGCLVVCGKFDVNRFITTPYGLHYNLKLGYSNPMQPCVLIKECLLHMVVSNKTAQIRHDQLSIGSTFERNIY